VGVKHHALSGPDAGERLVLDSIQTSGLQHSDQTLRFLSISESIISDSRFERLNVECAVFGGGGLATVIEGCSFDHSRIRGGAIGRVRFVDCTFRDCELINWMCVGAEFLGCVFGGTLRRMVFDATPRSATGILAGATLLQFARNDFSAADLVDVSFRGGIDLDLQVWPDDPAYCFITNPDLAVRLIRAKFREWDTDGTRTEAWGIAGVIEFLRARGQSVQFYRLDASPVELEIAVLLRSQGAAR
jgi:hypothetical protein